MIAVSGTGGITNTFTMDAWGDGTDEANSPFKFTSRRLDAETGNYYYRHRYYHADQGRFMSNDPIGYGDGLNMYAYAGNDPVNRWDPMGLKRSCISYQDINGLWTLPECSNGDHGPGSTFWSWATGNGKVIDVSEYEDYDDYLSEGGDADEWQNGPGGGNGVSDFLPNMDDVKDVLKDAVKQALDVAGKLASQVKEFYNECVSFDAELVAGIQGAAKVKVGPGSLGVSGDYRSVRFKVGKAPTVSSGWEVGLGFEFGQSEEAEWEYGSPSRSGTFRNAVETLNSMPYETNSSLSLGVELGLVIGIRAEGSVDANCLY